MTLNGYPYTLTCEGQTWSYKLSVGDIRILIDALEKSDHTDARRMRQDLIGLLSTTPGQ